MASNAKPLTNQANSLDPNEPKEPRKISSMPAGVRLISIGVSTGGPVALAKLLGEIPKYLPVPIMIAQHMPAVFTGLLAKRLSEQTGHKVCEAKDGDQIEASRILIAPGDYHMLVKRCKTRVEVRLNQDPPVNSCRPAVDPFFKSVAQCFGNRAVGVVLTGMGQDGMSGAGLIKSAGGTVFAQDESSSVVWGMPGKVVSAGFADHIMDLSDIAESLTVIGNASRLAPA